MRYELGRKWRFRDNIYGRNSLLQVKAYLFLKIAFRQDLALSHCHLEHRMQYKLEPYYDWFFAHRIAFNLTHFTAQCCWNKTPAFKKQLPQKDTSAVLISRSIVKNYWCVLDRRALKLRSTADPSGGDYSTALDMDFQAVMRLKIILEENENFFSL